MVSLMRAEILTYRDQTVAMELGVFLCILFVSQLQSEIHKLVLLRGEARGSHGAQLVDGLR